MIAGGAGAAFVDLIDGLRDQLQEELDLRNEARTMAYFRSLPETRAAAAGRRARDLRRAVEPAGAGDGVPRRRPDRRPRLGRRRRASTRAPLVEQVVQAWFMTALRGGIFHGDIHAGNILLLTDGRVGLLDWGIVGRLDPDIHRMLRAMVAGALGDEGAWQEVADAFFAQIGERHRAFGIDADTLAPMLAALLGGILTQPFGEVSLAELIMAPMRQAEELRRQRAPRRRSREPSRSAFGRSTMRKPRRRRPTWTAA